MKSIERRLGKLEHRLGIATNVPRLQVIMIDGDAGPTQDGYLKILDETEFLPAAGSCKLDFTQIPCGHNAKEAETNSMRNAIRRAAVPHDDERH